MESRWLRYLAALGAFIVVAVVGIVLAGGVERAGEADPFTGAYQAVADVLALILAVALFAAIGAYLAVEFRQTGSMASVGRQFTTRTLVLMPIAIALNIVLGAAVANALRIPIYLDSIGTIMVGVLAGPLAGAATGFTANILWAYVIPPPFGYPPAAAFAVVAAVIGLLAGAFGRAGLLRPRLDRSPAQLLVSGVIVAALILGLAYVAFIGYVTFLGDIGAGDPTLAPDTDNPVFTVLAWLAVLLLVGTVIGLFAMLFIRRDLTAAYVVLCGAITGVVAGLISAPISAGVFSGVTGAGTDFLVAAFREAGATIYLAALGQSLISDPIDKIVTYLVVFLILSAMARRMKARFPQGEALLESGPALEEEPA